MGIVCVLEMDSIVIYSSVQQHQYNDYDHDITVTSSCRGGNSHAKVHPGRHVLRELWAVLQLVVLHAELLVGLPPGLHVEVAVRALLVGVLLLGGLHAGSSRDPKPLLLVVAPVATVSVYVIVGECNARNEDKE